MPTRLPALIVNGLKHWVPPQDSQNPGEEYQLLTVFFQVPKGVIIYSVTKRSVSTTSIPCSAFLAAPKGLSR